MEGTLIRRKLAPSRSWYSFNDPVRMEGQLWRKRGDMLNIRQRRNMNLEPCGWKAEILPLRQPRRLFYCTTREKSK